MTRPCLYLWCGGQRTHAYLWTVFVRPNLPCFWGPFQLFGINLLPAHDHLKNCSWLAVSLFSYGEGAECSAPLELPPSAVPKVEIISTLTSVATDLWKGNQWDNSCMWCGQRWHMYKQGRHCTVRKHRHGRKAPYPTVSKQQISNHVKDTLLILKILKRFKKKTKNKKNT